MSIIKTLPAYIDETNDTLIKKAVLGGKSLGLFTLQTGVKTQSAIMLLDTDVVLQDGSNCDFTDLGSSTISERIVKAPFIKVNTTFCAKTLANSALQYGVSASANQNALPFEADFVGDILKSVEQKNEILVWQGNTALTGTNYLKYTDGLIKIIKADVPSGNIVGSTSGLTAANIIAEVDAIYAAIPSAVLSTAQIFMGTDSYRKYAMALQAKNLFFPAPASDVFDAFYPNSATKIVAVGGLDGTDFIVAADPKKIVHGTDLTGDAEEFKMTYHLNKFYLEIGWTLGVQVARPAEIVYRYKA